MGSDCEVVECIGRKRRITLFLDALGKFEGTDPVLGVGERLKLSV